MRLLQLSDCSHFSLTEDSDDDVPPYGILSHTWAADNKKEITFKDVEGGTYTQKEEAYAKILFCGQQAALDGLRHFWVDTCCINKADPAETAEAITSMFRWYSKAAKCYVYLSDVSASKRDNRSDTEGLWRSAFQRSKWFTRGWTLQELLAPPFVVFYSRDGRRLGDKSDLTHLISQTTGIPHAALHGAALSNFSLQERMQWALKRITKKVEDRAYCLQGICGVYILPNYGEGEYAWLRLADEVGRRFRSQLDGLGQSFSTSNFGTPEWGTTWNNSRIVVGSSSDHRQHLFASLAFDQMENRRRSIREAFASTGKWLFTHAAYQQWIDSDKFGQHGGRLSIRGKPGSGKSTLLKALHEQNLRRKFSDEIIVSFYFNARGRLFEKSVIGMYRSIIYQLLAQSPDLQTALDYISLALPYQGQQPQWTSQALCRFLAAIIPRLRQRRIVIFIDALDECEGRDEMAVREMITFFDSLAHTALHYGTQMHTCFTSRHYPLLIQRGLVVTLDDQEAHVGDLSAYVGQRLLVGIRKSRQRLVQEIVECANGLWLWAVLAVNGVNRDWDHGQSMRNIREGI